MILEADAAARDPTRKPLRYSTGSSDVIICDFLMRRPTTLRSRSGRWDPLVGRRVGQAARARLHRHIVAAHLSYIAGAMARWEIQTFRHLTETQNPLSRRSQDAKL
jgi:hypothetical protein